MLFLWDVSHITLWCKILAQVGFSGSRNWSGDLCVSAVLRDRSQAKGSDRHPLELKKELSQDVVSAGASAWSHRALWSKICTVEQRMAFSTYCQQAIGYGLLCGGFGGITSLKWLQVGWEEVFKERSSCEPLADNTHWWMCCFMTGILAVN